LRSRFHRCPKAAASGLFGPSAPEDAFWAAPSSNVDFSTCGQGCKNMLAARRLQRSVPGRRFRLGRRGVGSRGSIPGANFRAGFRRPRPAGNPLHTRPYRSRRRFGWRGSARGDESTPPPAAPAAKLRKPATVAIAGRGAGGAPAAGAVPGGVGVCACGWVYRISRHRCVSACFLHHIDALSPVSPEKTAEAPQNRACLLG